MAFEMAGDSARSLRLQAQQALANSPIQDLRHIHVEQRHGNLVIWGSVSQFYHKQMAQETVRELCGVIPLVNSIRVREGLPPRRG